MLKPEDNDLLTRTDKNTPMGDFMRCFWIPAMTIAEVPNSDEAPKRLRLLGEDLVVFRNTNGEIGVLEENCPHRGASLFFGRNEECGLRCVYHGWKFDTNGNVLDMPSEPANSPMKSRVKAVAYPSKVAGSILWVYMGHRDAVSALPSFEWMDIPETHRYVSRWEQECNYAQAMEGELDGAHVGFLHRNVSEVNEDDRALTGRFFRDDTAPKWSIQNTHAGFIAGSSRDVSPGKRYWRLNQFVLPFYTMIPPRPGDAQLTRMWVPRDDHHCWVICVTFRTDQPIAAEELELWRNGENSHRKVLPGTTVPVERLDNDYLIDRQKQKTISFTGIAGIRAQDAMVTETAGPVVDRSREHLGTSDRAVVAMRRRLMEEARDFARDGRPPAASIDPELYRVRATSAVIDSEADPEHSTELTNGARAPKPTSEAL
ncbi:Rieske 2Fe-2S domain-containing protein [Paraburkholderia sp. MM5482-R1]|uniref:Rieske 2Fe-2S domain-containing protein n=1 Tax=unclassified Paraburkholderia TaxID=2615204 RepID=UPI003D2158DA